MKKYISIILLLNICLFGSEPSWNVVPNDFEFSIALTGVIIFNGVQSENGSDIIAAFVNGECRGKASPVYFNQTDQYVFGMTIYSNAVSGDIIVFKAYKSNEDSIGTGQDTLIFSSNAIVGNGLNPEQMNFYIDHRPLIGPIQDQVIDEGYSFSDIDLNQFITNPDNEDVVISFTSNSDLVLDINSSNILSVSIPDENWNGSEQVIFRITDQTENAHTSFDTVLFIVKPVDDAPIWAQISNQSIYATQKFDTLHLQNYITEVDDDQISFSYFTNINNDSVSVNISDSTAVVNYIDGWSGQCEITFIASDLGTQNTMSDSVTSVFEVNSRSVEILDISILNEDKTHIVSPEFQITYTFEDNLNLNPSNLIIQVSSDDSFSQIDMWDTEYTSKIPNQVTYAGEALIDGGDYYLRMKIACEGYWSDWKYLNVHMNSIPSVPLPLSPINNEVLSESVVLTTNNCIDLEGDTLRYRFYIFGDIDLSNRIDSSDYISEGKGTTSWEVTKQLPDNQQYWWAVESFDGFENSVRSIPQSFLVNTENNAPNQFALTFPAKETEVNTLLPTFTWQSALDPDPLDTVYYSFYLDTPDPGVEIYPLSTDTFFVLTEPLKDNTEYYWRVVARDKLGFETENEGSYHQFSTNLTNENPSVVELISPDSVICVSSDVKYYWTPAFDPDPLDTVHYEVYWWEEFGQMNLANVDTNVYQVGDLNENGKYYWNVICMDLHDGISHTNPAVFWVDAIPEPPETFMTISAAKELAGNVIRITFVWNSSYDPDPFDVISYDLVYTQDIEDSSSYWYINDLTDTTSFINVEIPNGGKYYWKVFAKDNDQFRTPSNNDEWSEFAIVAIDGGLLVPEYYALHQNFPNPFNPTTTIKYDIPKTSLVILTIYNMNGQVVDKLVNQKQDPGFYSIRWDARNVSTGVYFYQIKAGDFQQVKKMLLVK